MPAKQLIFDVEARNALKEGADALANAVKVTRWVPVGGTLFSKNPLGHP